MAVPEVNMKLLEELQAMGFPLNRATRALHYSGNSSLEDAINWVIDHETDPDMDETPLVPVNIEVQASEPPSMTEQLKLKAQELRNRARRTEIGGKKSEREKVLLLRSSQDEGFTRCMTNEEKESLLFNHNKKLVIAFGLLKGNLGNFLESRKKCEPITKQADLAILYTRDNCKLSKQISSFSPERLFL